MNQIEQSLLNIQSNLQDINISLTELGDTCCMPDRSKQFQTIEKSLSEIEALIATKQSPSLHTALNQLTQIGANIGELQVSCCTPIREKIYQQLLKLLNRCFMHTSALIGMMK